MKAYILRGLPGSGKTTWTEELIIAKQPTEKSVGVFSADLFHIIEGVYKFDPARAPFAHAECLRTYIQAIREAEYDIFVVDNTNTRLYEIAPYVAVANAFGIEYEIVQFLCQPSTSLARNIHQVPAATILAMNTAILTEHIPPFWKLSVAK